MNYSLIDDLPSSVLKATGMAEEQRMPSGWNPSDDSEDDYTPVKAASGARKRGKEDTSEDDEAFEEGQKKRGPKKGRKPSVNGSVARMKAETDLDSVKFLESEKCCVLCGVDVGSSDSGMANLRFHYAQEHYFPAGSFAGIAPPFPEDLPPGQKLPRDLVGKVYKYFCQFQPCTQRKMGYKELVLHLATQHHQLRVVMEADTGPEMAIVRAALYPDAKDVEKPKANFAGPGKYSLELEDSEDVDDPSAVLPIVPGNTLNPNKLQFGEEIKAEVKPEFIKEARTLKIHDCLLCDAKDGKAMKFDSGAKELRYHYAVCFYVKGAFVGILDPGNKNRDEAGKALEEYGTKFKYTCPIPKCHKNQGRVKAMGFKELCIHAAVEHHQLERVLGIEETKWPDLAVLRAKIASIREEEGGKVEVLPPPGMEEMHTCLLCKGKDKEGINLSFNKLFQIRYHYANCYFSHGVYLSLYPPGKHNTDTQGNPKDTLGVDVKYSCSDARCNNKRKMGYKEFTIHMANEHGGLETVMMEDEREEIRNLVEKIRKK